MIWILLVVAFVCLLLFVTKGAQETYEREMSTIRAHESLVFKPKRKSKRTGREVKP